MIFTPIITAIQNIAVQTGVFGNNKLYVRNIIANIEKAYINRISLV